MKVIKYKNYFIEELYGIITVPYRGEDLEFKTVNEAKNAIDKLNEGGE